MKRLSLIAASIGTASALMFGATAAQAEWAVVAPSAPPAPRYEVVPAPQPGRAWVEGHWEWRNGEYQWQAGHWMSARSDSMEWVQGQWRQRPDGEWAWVEGHWRNHNHARGNPNRDNDHDGVANRYDRYPWDSGRS